MNYIEQLRVALSQKSPLYLRLKVTAGMPKTQIIDQLDDQTYKIWVGALPIRGASNQALCKYLKKTLSASEAVIVSGGRDKFKLIRLSR